MGMLSQTYQEDPGHRKNFDDFCTIGTLFQTWDDDDKAWFVRVMADPDQSTRYIMNHLATAGGIRVSDTTLGRHRRRECRCVSYE